MNRENMRKGPQGTSAIVPSLAARAEALLRSLNGIGDARVELDRNGRLGAVHIVPSPGIQSKALLRNVQSGLMAALGVGVDARFVYVVQQLPALKAPQPPAADVEEPRRKAMPQADAPAAVQASRAAQNQRRLVGVGKMGLPALNGYKPVPRVEVLEMQRFNNDQLQCRVVVDIGGRRRTGTAEAGDEREGAVTLAARATLDALRHIEMAEWQFEGAADVIIAGQRHIVVSVKKNNEAESLSGAAPVDESVEHAVAVAVLNAAGLSGAVNQDHRRVAQR